LFIKLGIKLVTERDTSHTILNAKDVIVDRIHSVKSVTTSWTNEGHLRVVNAREVKSASWLGLAHSEAEWPAESWKVVKNIVWEIGAMHFWNNVVVVDVGSFLEKGNTVNVERRLFECELVIPVSTSGQTRDKVERLHWVVEVTEVKVGIDWGRWLVLGLGDQQFVFTVGEELAFIGIQVDVVRVHLWRGWWSETTVAALDTDFNVVVLKSHEWESLCPVLTEEEWNHVIVS